jgi:glycosyltransferase involved in cell wall biosynthesis
MSAYRPGVLVMVNAMLTGGAEKHALSLVDHLDPARFRTALCHVKDFGKSVRDLHAARLESVLALNVRGKFEWRAVKALARYIDEQRMDIVVCTNGYPLLYALLASWLARRPVRLVEVFHTTGLRTSIKSPLRMLMNRFVFRQCELVVYVSHKQREYWRAGWLGAQRDVVIHNGIDTDYFTDRYTPEQKAATRREFGFAPRDYVIGICASLRAEKAHQDLLHGLRRLRDAGVPARVLIIGDGPQRPMLERLIAELRLQSDAVISGHRDDVRPYIACCDVMTLTSHVVETFSLAALESMSLAKPVVLTRIGGAEEQVQHGVNGLLFEPGDVAALVRNLRELADAECRRRMGIAAAELVRERFTLQRMVAKFTDELQKLTDTPPLQLTSTVPN